MKNDRTYLVLFFVIQQLINCLTSRHQKLADIKSLWSCELFSFLRSVVMCCPSWQLFIDWLFQVMWLLLYSHITCTKEIFHQICVNT